MLLYYGQTVNTLLLMKQSGNLYRTFTSFHIKFRCWRTFACLYPLYFLPMLLVSAVNCSAFNLPPIMVYEVMLNYLVQESDRWQGTFRQKDMSAKNGCLPKKQVGTQFGRKV